MRILKYLLITQIFFLPVDSAFGGCFSRKSKNSGIVTLEEKYKKYLDVPEWYERSIDVGGALYSPKDLSSMNPRVLYPLGRKKLIELVDQVFRVASLNRSEDTEKESIQKYFASLMTTATSINIFSSNIISPIGWLVPMSQRIAFRAEYERTGLWQLWNHDVYELLSPLPNGHYSLARELYTGGFGYWRTYSYLEEASKFLDEQGFFRNSIDDSGLSRAFEDSTDFFLSTLVVRGFKYWRVTNLSILESIENDSRLKSVSVKDVIEIQEKVQTTLKEIKASDLYLPFSESIRRIFEQVTF